MGSHEEVFKAARVAYRAGLSVVPPRGDGSKAPLSSWLKYQEERATKSQIDEWYRDGREGIGIVCGQVSGNLTMLEFEDEDTWQTFRDNAERADLWEIVASIADGWMERAPGGGRHLYYRCETQYGNKKLAMRPLEANKMQVLIETRGEGGFSVIAPSYGSTHPSGKPYEIMSGGPSTVATISTQDQHDIFQLCESLDEREPSKEQEVQYVGLLRPGDDFNRRGHWRQILEPHGWRFLFERGGVWYLRRPHKDRGISATVNWGGFGCFRNFSTSTPFDAKMYTKFSVYVLLNHRGDAVAAAKELARQGYGGRDSRSDRASAEVDGADGTEGGRGDDTLHWRTPDDNLERPVFPGFPVHHLPSRLRSFCKGVAESIQVPYDYPAMTMLATLSAATRGRFRIALSEGGHSEPLTLHTVLFADSGTRKSAAFRLVKEPLSLYEEECRDEDRQRLALWEAKAEIADKGISRMKTAKVPPLEMVLQAAIRERDEMEQERPVVTRLVADDITPERLGTLIADQKGAIAIMAPEGGFFANIAGRYAGGIPNMEYVLRGHDGESLVIDRMGRESYVKSAHVTIGISLQPTIVQEFAATPGFRGKGMAARILPSFPVSPVGARSPRKEKPVPEEDTVAWRRTVISIIHMADDAGTDARGWHIPYNVVLSTQAREVYYQYAEHVERQLAKGGGLQSMQDWGGKLPGQMLRVAGLLHLAKHGNDAVGVLVESETISDAIAVMEYFIPHARYLLNRIDGIAYGDGLLSVMNILRELPKPIYKTTVVQRLKKTKEFKGDRDGISDTLDELELMGYLRVVPEAGNKIRIELNPSLGGTVDYETFVAQPVTVQDDWYYEEDDDE